jgi:hypothetical protein
VLGEIFLVQALADTTELSSRPKRSAAERPAVQRSFLGNVFDRGVMGLGPGLGPTQGDKKRLLVQQLLCLEAPPSPLSSRPKRSAAKRSLCGCSSLGVFFSTADSWAFSPPKVMKNGSCSATTVDGSATLHFVISTEAYPDFLLRAASDGHVCGSP